MTLPPPTHTHTRTCKQCDKVEKNSTKMQRWNRPPRVRRWEPVSLLPHARGLMRGQEGTATKRGIMYTFRRRKRRMMLARAADVGELFLKVGIDGTFSRPMESKRLYSGLFFFFFPACHRRRRFHVFEPLKFRFLISCRFPFIYLQFAGSRGAESLAAGAASISPADGLQSAASQ